jgi:sec-independent protein translocase protein TatB
MPDMLFIFLLALVLLGPKKLPQVAAQVGKYLAEFQRMRRELLDQVNAEVVRMEASQAQLTATPGPAPPPAPSLTSPSGSAQGPGQASEPLAVQLVVK